MAGLPHFKGDKNMKFNDHKNKPKIITVLLICIVMLSVFISSFQVYADDYNGTEGSGTGNVGTGNIGASQNNTAFFMYLVYSDDGTAASPGILIYNNKNGDKILDFEKSNFLTKDGELSAPLKLSDKIMTFPDSKAPYPVLYRNGKWKPNGNEVREYLMKRGSSGRSYYQYILEQTYGIYYPDAYKKALEKWQTAELSIVIQPVAKLHYKTSYNRIATTDGWIQWADKGYQHSFLTSAMYNCMVLETDRFGISAPVKTGGVYSADYEKLKSTGYGIHIIDINPSPHDQTTCNEPEQPDPHKPPEESTGTFKIVKSYRTRNTDTGILTDKGNYIKEDSGPGITIEDESEYKLVAWKTSTTYDPDIMSTEWESKVPSVQKQSGTDPSSIEIKTPETTLYVLLEKPEGDPSDATAVADFIISQSTITRKIKLSQPDGSGMTLLKDIGFKWQSPAHEHACSHTYTTGSGEHKKTHTSHCSWGKWTDNSVNFSLKNAKKSDYPDIVATKAGWETVTTTGLNAYTKRYQARTRTIADDLLFTINGWDYSCVLLRGKDKLTVAGWKNDDLGTSTANTDLASVSSSGFSIGNSATESRKKALYYDSFSTLFTDDSPDLTTTYRTSSGDGHGHNCGSNSRSLDLEDTVTINANVRVETYSGTPSGASIDTSCDSSPTGYGAFIGLSVLSDKNMVRGKEVPSGADLSFRPYIQMNYDVQTSVHEAYGSSTTDHRTAYVLGDIQRGISPNDYAEISWKERDSDKPNLTLNSLQWSTHASAVDFIINKLGTDNLSKFTVLPGGATLDLLIKDTDRQKVMVTTYQCIIDGSGKTQIDHAGGSYTGLTQADAENSHKAYVNSVIDGLDHLNIEQWITDNISGVDSSNINKSDTDVWNISKSSMVEWDVNLKAAGHPDQRASKEYKYYLSPQGGRPEAPASEGDLDVKAGKTTTRKYTFFTNTKGEIRYTVNDINPNVGNENKGVLANDTIANQINKRTHVVDKLQAAIERGTGNDPSGRSKTGTQWYNEAFDGITVYVQTTELMAGYIDPPQRSTVLDPKLTQTQDNQKDMFNIDKYNMSQYKTRDYSDIYLSVNVAGQFKGEDVEMKDMGKLFFSKKFFIPNATVDDLH